MNERGLDDGTKKTTKGGDRKERAPLPLECPRCGLARKPGVKTCPGCGFTPDPGKLSKVTFADGELQKAERSKSKLTMAEKQSWYSAILHYALSRGYKPGYAYYAYNAWAGVNVPNKLRREPAPPTQEQLDWIKKYEAKRFADKLNAKRK
jgi:hypothetical protein